LISRFGIRGIPALVVMDTISGSVVVQDQARNEVVHACRRGDEGVLTMVQSWLSSIPEESQLLVESIKLSLQQALDADTKTSGGEENSYLVRPKNEGTAKFDPAERVKHHFTLLVAQGKDPNSAAAEAMTLVAKEKQGINTLSKGPFDSFSKIVYLDGCCVKEIDGTPSFFSETGSQLKCVRVFRKKESKSIVGLQPIYQDETSGSRLSSLAIDTELDEMLLTLPTNGSTMALITLSEKEIENIEFVSNMLEDLNGKIVLEVPHPMQIVGLHGVWGSSGCLVSLGLVCAQSSSSPSCSQPVSNLPPHIVQQAVHAARNQAGAVQVIVDTAFKYLENAAKQPFNPKFRTFKLNNKVSDRIAQLAHGVDLLVSIGFNIVHLNGEYTVNIPIGADLTSMAETLEKLRLLYL